MLNSNLTEHFLQVAIILLAVVAAVAAESYGYDKSYKPAAYAAPAYSKPAYKEEYAYVILKIFFSNFKMKEK